MYTSFAWIAVFGILTIICWFAVWKFTKTKDFNWENIFYKGNPTIAFILAIIGAFLIVLFIIAIITQTFDIITCLTFPEKIIFELIKEMT